MTVVPEVYLNETMFRWDGWSMVAQRPGKTIAPVPGEKLVYLFDWNDVSHDNTEFIAFLKKTFHARWTEKEKTTIQKQGTDTIIWLVRSSEAYDENRNI